MGRYNQKNGCLYCDIMALHPEVTGSCIFCVVRLPNGEKFKFLVDCGLYHEKKYQELNKTLPFYADDLAFVLVTHNHVDHTGRLPLLAKKGYPGKYYASQDTCKLLPLALEDCGRILESAAEGKNEKPIYGESEICNVISHLQPITMGEQFQPHENVTVTAIQNNHLIGAVSYLVQISYEGFENINIFFTGDLKENNLFLEDTSVPKWIRELPVTLITESTYGDTKTLGQPVFKRNVARAINKGGNVIIPVFSLGRVQEVLYTLKEMQKEKLLDPRIPIYLDGKLAIAYTKMFLNGSLSIKSSMVEFLPENFHFIDGNIKTKRRAIKDSQEPKIILCSSGMGTHGIASSYIQHYVKEKDALIHFSGYCTEGTVGDRLKEVENGTDVYLNGRMVRKEATVEYTDEFSGHIRENDLIDYLSKFSQIKLLIINHGEAETKEQFGRDVKREISPKDIFILDRENAVRINAYGFDKSFKSKF